jgi:hypothetical protein
MLKRILLIVLLAASIAHADYLGSWAIDDYVPIPAAIHRFSTGIAYLPTTLTYSIYEDGNATGIDEDVDMTPASPFDGKTGLYLARRQLTAAAGFEAGKNYTVRVYVDVDSVQANQWHTFQIEAETRDSSYDTDAEYAEAIWGAAVASYTDEADFGGELGGLDPNVTLILADTSAQDAASEWTTLMGGVALDDVNETLPGKVWDEVITAAAHGTADSAAIYVRQLWQTIVTRVAQCGDAGGATTIDLDAGASGVTNYYVGQLIAITSGTGAGQARTCTGYNGTSNVATIAPAWATVPDGNSWFAVINTGSTVVADWADGGRLDVILDNINTNTALGGVGRYAYFKHEKRLNSFMRPAKFQRPKI